MTDRNSPASAADGKEFASVFISHGAPTLATDDDENPRGRSLHRGWTHGSLSMNAYLFGGEGAD